MGENVLSLEAHLTNPRQLEVGTRCVREIVFATLRLLTLETV